MALLSVQKLAKSFGERSLFSDVSFDVEKKDHIGLIGANGMGKSTLFRMLEGNMRPDSGGIHKAKLLRIRTLEQLPSLAPGQSVYDLALEVFAPLLAMEQELNELAAEFLKPEANHADLVRRQNTLQERYQDEGGLTCRSRAQAALRGLGFSEEELFLPATALSGGQLNKVMLARVLLCEADLLLLDEPTNHLDILAVEWLESYLKAYTGAFIVISHDRYFLDQITGKTMELCEAGFFVSPGNYSRHVELRMSEKEFAMRKYKNTQKEIRRIYGIVEQQRRWNRERNIKTAESKLKQIEKLKATLIEPEKEDASIRFSFHAAEPGGNDVLLVNGLGMAYGEKRLFDSVDMQVRKGERVFLLGPNGCGKTTLLNILSGRQAPVKGDSMLGAGVRLEYYEQNMRGMREENTVLQEVWDAYPRLNRTDIHSALAAFLFRGDEVYKTIGVLSGGERARVQLLKLMLSGANLLLLDEPTNHLDIASKEALEKALEDFEGALLVVTHDRYLVNRLADRVLFMDSNGVRETIGGYDAFLQALAERPGEVAAEKERPQNEYSLKKSRQVELARMRGRVSALEKEVAEEESRIAELAELLAQPAVMQDYQQAGELSAEIERKRADLEGLFAKWEQAAGEMETLRAEE